MVLGITDNRRPSFENYLRWIQHAAPDAKIVKLSYGLGNADAITQCDGLVLTGGGDIHPKYYNREDALGLMEDVDPSRDEFEFELVRNALDHEVPILGVCRGMQLFNVAMGGSMIPDVQRAGYSNHSKSAQGDRSHAVWVHHNTILHSLVCTDSGEVNSSHHQAVDRVGNGLRVSARSEDGLIEGLEWTESEHRPFVLLVQWHPERMKKTESPFAKGILQEFVKEVATITSSEGRP
jgi:putative glutamine amidotransferase